MKTKFGIVGCGFLGNIVADAWKKGLLEDYELVGVTSRTLLRQRRRRQAWGVRPARMWMLCWRWNRSTSWKPLRWKRCGPWPFRCCAGA